MKLQKKEPKSKAISTKVTDKQNDKLEALALKHGITKSSLIGQLLESGYKTITKNKEF